MYYHRNRTLFSKLHLDWPLLISIVTLSSLGLMILYSAKPEMEVIQRQFFRLLLAGTVMLFLAQLPPRFFRLITPFLYFSALMLLAAVLIVGDISKGGQRWLNLWVIRFQPAELMKIAVPMMVAKYFEDVLLPPKPRKLFIPLILILAPVLLIAKQPDLGTALLVLSTGLLVLFFSGIAWQMVFSLSFLFGISLPPLWFFLHDYQKQRILTLLDPTRDPLGSGYQIIQSKIAIGSGGLWGKGWLNGTQSHLEFLPERTTDFIFAVFGEEFGLVGCIILLILYLCIIIRCLYISMQAQDSFCRLLAGSLSMTLFVYVFVNIGMVCGILPVVGIPLPLVSYGGTSLVTLMVGFGILMSIHTHRTLLAK
jgi:rod shape determining protein RodA